MNIYFAASIAGGRLLLPTYEKMVDHLKSLGHTVLTEHIIAPDVLDQESHYTPVEVYCRDAEWLRGSHALIAEVSNPSLGVGYEICYALDFDKPVLALYRRGVFVSRMITGNDRPGIKIVEYGDEPAWREQISQFLGELA